jgi:hypothetical protein
MTKRRRKTSQASSAVTTDNVFHLIGLSNPDESLSLENCLQELEGTMVAPTCPPQSNPKMTVDSSVAVAVEKDSRISVEFNDSYEPSEEARNLILNWNTSFHTWVNQGVCCHRSMLNLHGTLRSRSCRLSS